MHRRSNVGELLIQDTSMADTRKTVAIVAGSLAGTALILVLVFSLSGWAYRRRGLTLHDGRLRRVVDQHPTAGQVSEGILAEAGNWAIATPPSEVDLRRLLAPWPAAPVDEVLAKQRKWAAMRLFGVRDVLYVLYFDA